MQRRSPLAPNNFGRQHKRCNQISDALCGTDQLIRTYCKEDQAALLNCWEAAIRQSHPFLADEYIASERIAIPRTYLSKTKTLVVGSTGQVRGFLCKVEHLIAALFVHPDHQGFGFGRALLDHVQRPGLIVEVYEANLKARAFYHAYGFRHTTSRLHEDTGEALLCLTLDV